MDFIFQISPYKDPAFVRQVSDALEKRTELRAREQHPGLWRVTDRLNGGKVPEDIRKKRHIRYRIYGVLLIVMGVILIVPGLMEPEKLLVPLIAGAVGLLAGLFTLWAGGIKSRQTRRFDQAAGKLLKEFEAPPLARVRFVREGMEIGGKLAASYADFDFAAETKDLFLLTWRENVIVLQKKDLAVGDRAQFGDFLMDRMKGYGTFYSFRPF